MASEKSTDIPGPGRPISGKHIRQLDELPAFDEIIESWPPLDERDRRNGRIVVLKTTGGNLLLVSTLDAHLSTAWFHILDKLKRQGHTISGICTGDRAVFEVLDNRATGSTADQAAIDAIIQGSAPLRDLAELVGEAIDIGASDIHLEVRGTRGIFRVRIGGVLRKLRAYPAPFITDAISAGFTVIAEELSRSDAAFNVRLAQQAMIPLQHKGVNYNLRYQSHPAVGGYDVVLRILKSGDNAAGQAMKVRELHELGYLPSQTEQLDLATASAWGGVFIAGITGSGKTTTLNSMLSSLVKRGGQKVISIEDPVEYVVPGVTHLSIQRSNALSAENPFLNAMRAFLRLDPDVGMFGEIRDGLSGEIAQAAIETGHKIFTTVHATSALGIVARLTSKVIGLERSTVCNPEFISVLVYQTLLPRNCPHCKRPAREVLPAADLAWYPDVFGLDIDRMYCASDQGCPRCRIPGVDYSELVHAGTSGVRVCAEVITPDEELLLKLFRGQDMDARAHYRRLRRAPFSSEDMTGKEAWGHALYNVAIGEIDPYYFQTTFGHPKLFAPLAAISATERRS